MTSRTRVASTRVFFDLCLTWKNIKRNNSGKTVWIGLCHEIIVLTVFLTIVAEVKL